MEEQAAAEYGGETMRIGKRWVPPSVALSQEAKQCPAAPKT